MWSATAAVSTLARPHPRPHPRSHPRLHVRPRPHLRPRPRWISCRNPALDLAAGLWHTWFDRDLSVCGRVLVRAADGGIDQQLVKIARPVLRVPTLCIHLQSAEEREAFKVNKEDHLQPILALEAHKALSAVASTAEGGAATAAGGDDGEGEGDGEREGEGKGEGKGKGEEEGSGDWAGAQEPLLVQMLAEELGVPATDIIDFECSLYDTQNAAVGGAHSEFLYSSRLDNLASCFVAVEALVAHAAAELADDTEVYPPHPQLCDMPLIRPDPA